MRVAGIPLGGGQNTASANPKLLLNFDAVDSSSVFVDGSTYNNTMTNVGMPTIAGNKGIFDGNSYIYTDTLPSFLDKDFEITGKFTISTYAGGFQAPAIFGYNEPITTNPMALEIIPYGTYYKRLHFVIYDGVNIPHDIYHQTDVSLNVEHTFKVERALGVVRLWLDDVEADTSYAIGSETVISNNSRFCIAKGGSTYALFEGKIDDVSVSIFD